MPGGSQISWYNGKPHQVLISRKYREIVHQQHQHRHGYPELTLHNLTAVVSPLSPQSHLADKANRLEFKLDWFGPRFMARLLWFFATNLDFQALHIPWIITIFHTCHTQKKGLNLYCRRAWLQEGLSFQEGLSSLWKSFIHAQLSLSLHSHKLWISTAWFCFTVPNFLPHWQYVTR